MTVSKGRRLLRRADAETDRLRRHLLTAAALCEVLTEEPIVVGGTAEEFWTEASYHETDLDMCVPLRDKDRVVLAQLGFVKEGRHWVRREARTIAVEFPCSRFDGDPTRVRSIPLGEGAARMIGLDDLYLDRLLQSTIDERREGIEFNSALAVATARYEQIDWKYVEERVRAIAVDDPVVGKAMARISRRIQARVRKAL